MRWDGDGKIPEAIEFLREEADWIALLLRKSLLFSAAQHLFARVSRARARAAAGGVDWGLVNLMSRSRFRPSPTLRAGASGNPCFLACERGSGIVFNSRRTCALARFLASDSHARRTAGGERAPLHPTSHESCCRRLISDGDHPAGL